jgi:hypothetical protein
MHLAKMENNNFNKKEWCTHILNVSEKKVDFFRNRKCSAVQLTDPVIFWCLQSTYRKIGFEQQPVNYASWIHSSVQLLHTLDGDVKHIVSPALHISDGLFHSPTFYLNVPWIIVDHPWPNIMEKHGGYLRFFHTVKTQEY